MRYSLNCFKQKLSFYTNQDIQHIFTDAFNFHQSLPEYNKTELYSLDNLANELGIGSLFVKDESTRFGIKAFKALGASYAIYRFIKEKFEQNYGVQFQIKNLFDINLISGLSLPIFCTATDGNHGRSVAWFSRLIGHKAVIYMPSDSVEARIENIKSEGAEVIIVDGTYDDAVFKAKVDAEQNGWQIISDTSYDNYKIIPEWITFGYSTMFQEIEKQSDKQSFDFIFCQGGVGSFPASASKYYSINQPNAKLVMVEPVESACLLESSESSNGEPVQCSGKLETIMAGLNCGRPSLVAWDDIKNHYHLFIAIEDDFARDAMRRYYYPLGDDRKIISGESGAAGLAGLLALLENKELCQRIGLNQNSRVLLFNTEGDTDPLNFSEIVKR